MGMDVPAARVAYAAARQLKNAAYFGAGLATLLAVCAKHRLAGYTQPTGEPPSDWENSARNAELIVEDYRRHAVIDGRRFSFEGARVLELGPGMTLGTGVLLAGLGVKSYHAIDAFPLIELTDNEFYLRLAERPFAEGLDRDLISRAAKSLVDGRSDIVSYAVDSKFDVQGLVGDRTFDLIVSNAAFEHIEDIDRTIRDLSACASPGAFFMAMIDFQTHSRIFRERDPNSIYRFPEALYRALHFPGQPNRRRPKDYTSALSQNGWIHPTVRSVATTTPAYLEWARSGLAAEFRVSDCDMHVLTGVIVAEKPR